MQADSPSSTPAEPTTADATPFEMWIVNCPYRKNGSPVVGTMGSTIRVVVMIEAEEWKRLTAAVPQLLDTQFNVGEFTDV